MPSRRTVLTGLAALAALGAGATWVRLEYASAMDAARRRIDRANSRIAPSRFGDIEYAVAGDGPPFLMIHGTGGGFDQGLLFARPLIGRGYQIIAPSRFGYLRSAWPADPSSENQADAFADLLDALKIDRAVIAGGSAGALSALQFAIRHPRRTAALVAIVPAAYAPNRPPARPWSPWQEKLAKNVLESDFIFWSAMALARDTIIETILATDPALVHAASPAEQARVEAILAGVLPVSARARGLLNDARLAGNPAEMDLARIAAPTLAISLEDDRYLTADAARHIAASVPGSELVIYPSGGHVWVGRDAEMFAAIDAFLRKNVAD